MTEDLIKLQLLINNRFGINISEEKLSAVTKHFSAETHSDIEDILKKMSSDDKFRGDFIEKITVPETYFFRNEDNILLFKDIVEQHFAKRNGLIILSAGCSTGEEPYTLAIVLKEFFPELYENSIIYAVDINKKALDTAKKGVYGKGSFRNQSLGLKEKYFERISTQECAIHPSLKKNIRFHLGNLIEYDFSQHSLKYDFIFCRNVFIYFDNDNILKVLNKFYDLMHENSYLFVGYTEMINQITKKFQTLLLRNSFIFQKAVEIEKTSELANGFDKIVKEGIQPEPESVPFEAKPFTVENLEEVKKIRKLISEENYEKAKSKVESYIKNYPKGIQGPLLKAVVLSFYQEHEKALKIIDGLERKGVKLFIVYLLKGILFSELSRFSESIKNFKIALTFNHSCMVSNFFLAFLYEELRFYNIARTYYSEVINNNDLFIIEEIRDIMPHLREEELQGLSREKLSLLNLKEEKR